METTNHLKKFLQHNLLPISVFLTGACVLIVEVVAVRVLSPHYGNTIFTVSSVISVILAALSVGYYIGGKLADKHPALPWFFRIILLSGLLLLGFHFLGTLILPSLSNQLSLTTGPLISSLILFLLPAVLLGMLSPYAVKLQSVQFPKQGVGSVSGKISFWSTFGCITGSLLAGFVLIPSFGINHIFIATGVFLFLLGLGPLLVFGLKKKHFFQVVSSAIFLVLLNIFIVQRTDNLVYSKDGIYEKITIYDGTFEERPTRFFLQDKSHSGAMFLDSQDPTDLVYDYTKYYSIYKVFNPNIQNALVIGGGAYSIPKALLAELPNANVDVSEIEPSLIDLAQEHFDLKDNPRLQNSTEDGRRFLRDVDKKYDLIFSDVYYSLFSIPSHFTTQEFFSIAKDKLETDGVFMANLIGDLSRQQSSLIMAEMKTFQTIFPNSYFFAVRSPKNTQAQNIIFVGFNSDKKIDLSADSVVKDANPLIQSLNQRVINMERFDLSSYPTLTDNYSPVDYLTAKTLQRYYSEKTEIDSKEILAVIDQQLRYGPRYIGAQGHQDVQKFLIAEMKEYTSEVKTQSWDYKSTDGKDQTLTNIIGRVNPSQERRIILATHYDSKKFADKDVSHNTEPVPGANDSASGVAVLIELARVLSTSSEQPKVGIDFIFFDGEEGDPNVGNDNTQWKPLGSTYFAENLSDFYKKDKPVSAVVLDMVCDENLKIYKEKSSVDHASSQVDEFWNIAKKIDSRVFQDEVKYDIRDDHTPLNKAGIPSFLLIDFDYPPFHTVGDTLDKCSAKSLETVTRSVLDYVRSIE